MLNVDVHKGPPTVPRGKVTPKRCGNKGYNTRLVRTEASTIAAWKEGETIRTSMKTRKIIIKIMIVAATVIMLKHLRSQILTCESDFHEVAFDTRIASCRQRASSLELVVLMCASGSVKTVARNPTNNTPH